MRSILFKVVVKETRPSSAAMVMRFLKMRDSLNVTNMSLLNNLAKQFSNVTKTVSKESRNFALELPNIFV